MSALECADDLLAGLADVDEVPAEVIATCAQAEQPHDEPVRLRCGATAAGALHLRYFG